MWSNISAPKSGLKAAQVGHQRTTSSSADSPILSSQENNNNNNNNNDSGSSSDASSPQKALSAPSGSSPVMRYKHAVCSCLSTGYIYIHGGRFGNGLQLDDDVWRFDPHHNSWLQLQTSGCKPPSLQEHTLIEHGGQLYMFGGQVSAASGQEKSFWRLDLASNQWWSLDMKSGMKYGAYLGPTNRRGHAACVYRNSMYIFGGYEDFRGSSSQLWQYDLLSERWELCNLSSTSACHPEPRHSHSAIVYNDSMYVYGGLSNLKPLGDLWRWSWKDKRWYRERTRGPGPGPLHGHTAVQAFGSMFVFGGERQNGRTTRSLWRLNLSNLCWQKVRPKGPRPNPTTWHVAIANPMNILDGANYLIEGADQNQELALFGDELAGCGARSFSDNCFQQDVVCNQQQMSVPMETTVHPADNNHGKRSLVNVNGSCRPQLGGQRTFGPAMVQQEQLQQAASLDQSSTKAHLARAGPQHQKQCHLSHSKSATSGQGALGTAAGGSSAAPGLKPKSKRKLRLNFLRSSKHKGQATKLEAGGNGKQGQAGKLASSWSAANIVNCVSGAANSSSNLAQPESGLVDDRAAGSDIEMMTINENNPQVSSKILDTLDTDIKQMFEQSALGPAEDTPLGAFSDNVIKREPGTDEGMGENCNNNNNNTNENKSSRQSSESQNLNIGSLPPDSRMARESMTQSQLSSYVGPSVSSLGSSQTFQTAQEQLTSHSTLTITNANIARAGQAKEEAEVATSGSSRLGDIRQRRSMHQFNQAATTSGRQRKARPKSEIVQSLIDRADARIKHLYTPLFQPSHNNHYNHHNNYASHSRATVQQQQLFNSNDPILGHLQNHPMFERQATGTGTGSAVNGGQRSGRNLVDKSKRHTIHQTKTYYNLYFAEELSGNQQQDVLERRLPPTSSSQQVISPRRQDEARRSSQLAPTNKDTSAALIGVRGGSSADNSSITGHQNQHLATGDATTADTSLSSSSFGGLASSMTRSDSRTLCEAQQHEPGRHYGARGHDQSGQNEYEHENGYMNGGDEDGDDDESVGNYQHRADNQAGPVGSEMGGDNTSLSFSVIAEFEEDDMLQYSSPTDPNLIIDSGRRKSSAQVSGEEDEYEDQFDGDDEDERRSRADSRMQLDHIDPMDQIHPVGPRGETSTAFAKQQQQQSQLVAQKSTSSGYESIRSTSTATGQESPSNNVNNYQSTANAANNEQYNHQPASNGTGPNRNANDTNANSSNGGHNKAATSSTTVDSLTTTTSTSFRSNSNSIRVHSPPCKSLPLSSSSAEDELLMLHLRDSNSNNRNSNTNGAVDGRLVDGRQLSCNYAINSGRNNGANLSHSRSITSRLFSKKRTKTRYWQLCMFVMGGKQQPGAGSNASGGMLNEPINVWRLYI